MFKFQQTSSAKIITSSKNEEADFITADSLFNAAKKVCASAKVYEVDEFNYPRYRNLLVEGKLTDSYLIDKEEVNKFISLCIEELANSLMNILKYQLRNFDGEFRIVFDPNGIEYTDSEGCINYTRLYGEKLKNGVWKTVFILDNADDKNHFKDSKVGSVFPTLTFFEDEDEGIGEANLVVFLYEPWEAIIDKELDEDLEEIIL